MKSPVLKVAELRVALDRLVDAIEEQHGPEIDLPLDFYWNVPNSLAYGYEPPKLDMGSVVDDVQSLSSYANGSADEHTFVWHECQHSAGVLRAIAYLELD